MQRKDFMKVVVAGAVTGSLIAYLESCKKSSSGDNFTDPSENFTLDLTSSANAALLTSGGSVISNSVVVINNGGTYLAVSDLYTHQGCSLNYISSSKQFSCPCHGSLFAQSGAVINGPASNALKTYSVTKNGNTLQISG